MRSGGSMLYVLCTALGVGGATVLGAALGFLFKRIPHKYNDAILGFAAGVMMSAAMTGLIMPSVKLGGANGIWITVAGVLCGAVFLNLIDRLTPHMHALIGPEIEKHPEYEKELNSVLLFVIAIAIHNLPEGLAAGVSFGTGNLGDAFTVSAGIALQNIPEGMVIIAPMLAAGIKPGKAFWIAAATGMMEVVGTFLGYFAISVSTLILPFALAFAGGTMLYIISDEMIPETHSHGYERSATYAFLIGFSVMLILDHYIG